MRKSFGPPFLLQFEHSFIEDKIKHFSSNLFANKILGYFYGIQFNIYILSCFFKNKNCFTIFLELFLFYLLEQLFLLKLLNKNKK